MAPPDCSVNLFHIACKSLRIAERGRCDAVAEGPANGCEVIWCIGQPAGDFQIAVEIVGYPVVQSSGGQEAGAYPCSMVGAA
jgi:hypothetical protein